MAIDKNLRIRASYLRDAVFAASDGLVTTFAVVAGSAGASLSTKVVLILGFANLFADGFSMAAGNYLGTKSEIEYTSAQGDNHVDQASPARQGLVTFFAFNFAGLIPLVPYVFDLTVSRFLASMLLVALAMFGVGAFRGKFINKNFARSGIEMLFVGGFAALVAYATGELLKNIVR